MTIYRFDDWRRPKKNISEPGPDGSIALQLLLMEEALADPTGKKAAKLLAIKLRQRAQGLNR